MTVDDINVPEGIKRMLQQSFLEDLQRTSSLDVFEIELFEWYVREAEEVINKMLAAEREYIQKQINAEREDINDSGIAATKYYLKRVRYSHVIYLTSLVETFLDWECTRLAVAIGDQNIPFKVNELSGNQWERKRRFLERYGKFTLSEGIWRDIHDLITLRNNIVHNNGAVSELNNGHRSRLQKYAGIKLASTEVVLESSYVTEAFASVRKLCEAIDRSVGDAIQREIRSAPVSVSDRSVR